MGNLQSNDPKSSKSGKGGKVKNLMKIRGKKGKQEENQFISVVPEDAQEHGHASASEDDLTVTEAKPDGAKTAKTESKTAKGDSGQMLITDSWRKVNNCEHGTPNNLDTVTPSGDSSSDSVFAEALTPVGFSAEMNQCYRSEENLEISDDFLHDLTLNSFKLNDYRARKEEVIGKKLGKLGISKTSQISLEADPKECFASENVEIVTKDSAGDESGFSDGNVLSSSPAGDDTDGMMSPQKIKLVAKRLSDVTSVSGKLFITVWLTVCTTV